MATHSAWDRFIPRWRQMLCDTGPYPVDAFHAADVEARRPPFDGWSDKAREDLVQNALNLIADKSLCQNLYAISCSFVLPDYHLLAQGKKSSVADHYERCYRVLYQNIVSRWVFNGIEFVFDEKEKVKGRVQSHFYRVKEQLDEMPDYRGKLESCSFQDDREAVPLQAADLLAYEVRRRIWERLKNPNAPVRDAYQRIKESFAVRPNEPPYRERLFRCYDERFFTTLLATMEDQPGITENEVIDLWYLSDAPED